MYESKILSVIVLIFNNANINSYSLLTHTCCVNSLCLRMYNIINYNIKKKKRIFLSICDFKQNNLILCS